MNYLDKVREIAEQNNLQKQFSMMSAGHLEACIHSLDLKDHDKVVEILKMDYAEVADAVASIEEP